MADDGGDGGGGGAYLPALPTLPRLAPPVDPVVSHHIELGREKRNRERATESQEREQFLA